MARAEGESLKDRLRAVGSLWLCWAAVYLASEALLVVLLSRGAPLARELSAAADSTVAAASSPLLERLAAVDAPLALQTGVVNTLALLVLYALLPLLGATADPVPRGAFARRIDDLVWTHPALKWTNYVAYLFWPMRAFRRTPTLRLKGMCAFGAVPYLLPVLLGLQAGFVGGHLGAAAAERPVAFTLLGLALVLPHGLLELTALFIPLAGILQLYAALEPRLVAGDLEGVSATLHERAAWKAAGRWLPAALALVAAAACIEAELTLPFAEHVARALGLDVHG